VPGATVDDGNRHGTHSAGIACGPATSRFGPRYGVASGADLWVAKVLGDDGSGAERQILAGLDWAVGEGADVASMSLGGDVPTPRIAYERAGGRALRQGTLVVAAAGNNADRVHGQVGFVGVPANSTSVMAVGAIDREIRVANFSPRGNAGDGGRVDVVAPGVDVRSARPEPPGGVVLSGTSMATPHVAGVAAVLADVTGHRGKQLWADVTRLARVVAAASPLDVGAGLAHVDAS
jgi:subtilisin family serine protease